jgi:hypothetical protein
VLSSADVRQLTVYADLLKRREKLDHTVVDDFLSTAGDETRVPQPCLPWNQIELHLWPMRVHGWQSVGQAPGST